MAGWWSPNDNYSGWWWLEHDFYFPCHIWDVILPIDELIFVKMVIALLHHQPANDLALKKHRKKDQNPQWRTYFSDRLKVLLKVHESTKQSSIEPFNLVGGFKHKFYFPFHIWDVILPIDELIFFRGVGIPPTRISLTNLSHKIPFGKLTWLWKITIFTR